MRVGGEPVGRWGLAVMAVTAITGLGLALHGWSDRGGGAAPSLGGGTVAGRATPTARASAMPSAGSQSSSPVAAGPSASPAGAGPLLSSEPFAQASFQIWPGPMSSAAKQALTGLTVTVHKRASGLSVTAGVAGQGPGSTKLYSGGVRVYVVETSLGDDSGNSDYNLGDDGLVVTNAKGRIVQ
jgi:hypothetical protein